MPLPKLATSILNADQSSRVAANFSEFLSTDYSYSYNVVHM